ncbi:glycosyltransferase family 87 protein [Methylobacterium oryzisoli]|uniref:glycosyltransferase family 87 protein n=1 Tax=Methylobacterium oryzisoli TaxID=3385502 RepID=UPI00389247C9
MRAHPPGRILQAPDLAAVALGLAVLLPILLAYYRPAEGWLDVTGHPIGRDFINNWVGPRLAFSGRLATLFDLSGYHAALGQEFGTPLPFHNWGYPPFTLILLRPLALLPYGVALGLWTLGLFAVFAAVTLSPVPPERRMRALLLLALAPACLINAVGGQNGFLTAALFLGGLMALDRRPVLAGILFGLLTFKPHLGLILPFALVALGAWRTILAAATSALVLVAVSLAAFGIEPWQQYVTATSGFQYGLLDHYEGFFTTMMISVCAAARSFGLPTAPAFALQAAVTLPVLAATVYAVRETRDPLKRATVLAAAVPLMTPYAFNYDLTALSAVIVWRVFVRPEAAPERVVVWLAWVTPALSMQFGLLGIGFAPVPLLAFFALAVREAVGAGAPAAAPAR